MANIGEIAELVNSRKVRLDVGSDTYIAMQDINMHIETLENELETTDTGKLYHSGKSNNWFTANLFQTSPESDSLNTLTQIDVNGDMTSTAWKIVYTDRSGLTKTFAATGVLNIIDFESGKKGGAKMSIFVRITGGTISIT